MLSQAVPAARKESREQLRAAGLDIHMQMQIQVELLFRLATWRFTSRSFPPRQPRPLRLHPQKVMPSPT